MLTPLRTPKYARIVLFVILLWLFYLCIPFVFSSGSVRRLISPLWRSWEILNTTTKNSFEPFTHPRVGGWWLDLAGFRREDDFHWALLNTWQGRASLGSYRSSNDWKGRSTTERKEEKSWVNMTGILSGEWVLYYAFYSAGSAPSRTRDITGKHGMFKLEIDKKKSLEMEVHENYGLDYDLGMSQTVGIDWHIALVREIAATITIEDDGAVWEVRVSGIHWPRRGTLLLTTTSEKFAGIFGLPSLAADTPSFLSSRRLLSTAIRETLERLSLTDVSNPWTTSPSAKGNAWEPKPKCEYVAYVQLHPRERASAIKESNTRKAINETDDELRCLYGDSYMRAPGLQMSFAIFSPDCGFVLESTGIPRSIPSEVERWRCLMT